MTLFEVSLRRALGAQAVTIVLVFGIGCASSSQSLGSAVVPEGVDLTGSWVFNEEESDDTSELMPMLQGPQGAEAGMPGGTPQGSRMDPDKMRQTIQLAMDPKLHFSIEQADSSVEIATAWREPLGIRFDGAELKREYDWGELKVKAGWVGSGLIVEWNVDGGGKVRERYSLSTTTDQLFVVTRIEMGRRAGEPIEFRRVYDPAAQPLPDV